MKNKSILKILDLTVAQIKHLLNLSYQLKKNPQTTPPTSLTKKIILLLFQKESTRTRCSFEVAAHQLGLKTVFIGATGSQFGTKESVADSARVFGGYFDGIAFRGFKHSDAEVLAQYSRVPV